MKQICRCISCKQLKRVNHTYQVELHGQQKISGFFEAPKYEDVKEKLRICRNCAFMMGYRVKGMGLQKIEV